MKKLMIVTLTLFSAAAFAGSPMEKGADRHVQRMTQELNLSQFFPIKTMTELEIILGDLLIPGRVENRC